MDIVVLWLMAVFCVGVASMGVYWTYKVASKISKHRWPVLVLVDKHTPVAKAAIKYVERYVPSAESSVVVWNGKEACSGGILKSENLTDDEAAKLLFTALNEIGEGIGIQTALIRK